MNEKLKEIFDQVQAEEELKDKTKEYIFQKTNGYTRKKNVNYRHLISAAACMVLLLLGGHWIYFTPTVEISIDINPSMELEVNRFDRIISVEGRNDDGRELLTSLDVKYMNYSEAVSQIIESDNIDALLSSDEIMTIAVIGTDETQSAKVLSNIQSCTAGKSNTYCYYAHSGEVEKAHEMGLSYGKYRAFLELQALDPNVTAAEIQDMTMREIRDLIDKLTENGESKTKDLGNGKGYGRQGVGRGHGQGQKNMWSKDK